jgi:hypothetical protein
MVKRCGIAILFMFFPFFFSLFIVTQARACLHDANNDGDVDGADLAYNISHTTTLDPAGLATEFGRNDCQGVIPPVISLAITSPAEGETVTSPFVLVQGTFAGVAAETSVTANGVVALTDSGRFAANHVPLLAGANTITVTATDGEGNVVTTTIHVTCQPAANYIELISDMASGLAPLTVNFRIEAPFIMTSATTEASATGPAALDSITFTDSEHFTALASTPGLYVVTARVTEPGGAVYTDSAAILAMDKATLDALLKGKWNNMKSALAGGNIEGGLGYFLPQSQQRYREAFNAISVDLPQIFTNLPNIEMIYAKEGRVKYRVNRLHDINGTPVTITYYIYFVKNLRGIWQIEQF